MDDMSSIGIDNNDLDFVRKNVKILKSYGTSKRKL